MDIIFYNIRNMKNIANYTLDEFKEMFRDIPYDIVEIVYGFYHRDKAYTVSAYAMKKNISVATLYRYKNRVDTAYKRRQK